MSIQTKSRKKYNPQHTLIVRRLADKFQVTETYIYQSLRGDAQSDTAEAIRKEYNRLMKKLDIALK